MKTMVESYKEIHKRFERYFDRLHNILIAKRFDFLDPTCVISRKAIILGASNIRINAYTRVYPYSTILCADPLVPTKANGSIIIGKNSYLLPYSYINSYGGKIVIGDNFSINPYAILYGNGGLTIGNNVRIAAHSVIIPANHNFHLRSIPIFEQGLSMLGVEIKDDVWIGAGVYVLDGVVIEEGCVIGAGSVVTKSTEPYGVYIGNPAKRIKTRDE